MTPMRPPRDRRGLQCWLSLLSPGWMSPNWSRSSAALRVHCVTPWHRGISTVHLRSATYRASSRHTAPHCCGHQFACAHPAPQFRISAAAERTTRRSTSRARLVANSPVPRLLMTSVRESCKFDQSSRGTPILVDNFGTLCVSRLWTACVVGLATMCSVGRSVVMTD